MKTSVWKIDSAAAAASSQRHLKEAAATLCRGDLVAFPTETVYGLGADARSPEAIKKIFAAKGRPQDNPLIVHIHSTDVLERYVKTPIPPMAQRLFDACTPGPLTIILEKKDTICNMATAGRGNVGIRIPSHPTAQELLRLADAPIAAPSANISGKPSPTTAQHVYEDLGGRIAGIVDGGATGIGVESTVVDATDPREIVLCRPGGVSLDDLYRIVGKENVSIDPAVLLTSESKTTSTNTDFVARAPGMKYIHYAPRADVILVQGGSARLKQYVMSLPSNKEVGIMVCQETADELGASCIAYHCAHLQILGSRHKMDDIARNLYNCLRAFDSTTVDCIIAEPYDGDHITQAVMNRLLKACKHIE